MGRWPGRQVERFSLLTPLLPRPTCCASAAAAHLALQCLVRVHGPAMLPGSHLSRASFDPTSPALLAQPRLQPRFQPALEEAVHLVAAG